MSCQINVLQYTTIMRKKMTITIKSKADLVGSESIRRAADDTLTLAEAKKVRRGMRQIGEGKFKLWGDIKHEIIFVA